uniref:Uncharacterized protein n=1 Tax=Amphimedon queenslandica TaxID=400682 RepID=A0A1X7VCE3_AMPQE
RQLLLKNTIISTMDMQVYAQINNRLKYQNYSLSINITITNEFL